MTTLGLQSSNVKPRPFKDLPKRKRDFVKRYVRSGDAREAYVKAGYKDRASACNTLLRQMTPYLSAATTEYVTGTEMGIFGIKVIKELATTSTNDTVRLNAAKELMARSLPEQVQEQVVTHVHQQMSNEDLDQRLLELQDQLFISAPRLEVVK
jgi:phage terminase small subunit